LDRAVLIQQCVVTATQGLFVDGHLPAGEAVAVAFACSLATTKAPLIDAKLLLRPPASADRGLSAGEFH
jgi:hypothetical protein